jgi:citrate lyase subunit beta/citryl-CoA lyase
MVAGLSPGLVDAVLLPKVESPGTVARARAGLPAELPVTCMIETPRGVLAAAEIAAAPGVTMLVVGTSDLSKDLRVRPHPDRLPLLGALSQVVLAARAAGCAVLDGPCLDLESPDAFEREAAQGVALGFDGKTLIHPRTIDAANRLFTPSPEELAAARRVVEAFEAAAARGSGVVVVDGRLVEALHVQAARDRLALAAAIEASGRTGRTGV